jgi:hypothetical protein
MTNSSRRNFVRGAAGLVTAALYPSVSTGTEEDLAIRRAAYRQWLSGLPQAPNPTLIKHGLVAKELKRWRVMDRQPCPG